MALGPVRSLSIKTPRIGRRGKARTLGVDEANETTDSAPLRSLFVEPDLLMIVSVFIYAVRKNLSMVSRYGVVTLFTVHFGQEREKIQLIFGDIFIELVQNP